MVSTTEWQADASLWKEDRFFDAGTFCLPSVFPEASLEAYKVEYDLETGIHHVFLTLKGILRQSTLSTSARSSHVAEFCNGVMKAVPRRGTGGVPRHENPNGRTNSHRHTSSNIKSAADLRELDTTILSIKSEASIMAIDDSITATGRILGSSEQQTLKSYEHSNASIYSAILGAITSSSAEFPARGVVEQVENGESHLSSTLEEILLNQQVTSSSTLLEADAPTGFTEKADSTSNTILNTEEQIAISDNAGAVHSTNECPEQANALYIYTDLALKDDISRSSSNAPDSLADDGGKTPSMPATNATSPTIAPPLDLPEIDTLEEDAQKLIYALDLEEKVSFLEPWHWKSLQWLDLEISDEQNYFNYTCKKPRKIEEPKYAPQDEDIYISPRPSSPEEAEESVRSEELDIDEPEYAEGDQTVEVSPRLSSPEEVERPLRLEDLDLDTTFGQGATDLDGEDLPGEAVVADDEAVSENDTTAVGSPNDYSPNPPEFHHYNLLRNRVSQASRTPSALSLWVTMACKKRAHIKDPVCLKAVISSQAARWVDPVLIEEGASVPEEFMQDGSATSYRNSLIGLTKIQYEPYGTWLSDDYDDEQEIPEVVHVDNRKILDDAYEEAYWYPGLQRPYLVDHRDEHHHSHTFPCLSLKQQRGWESLERLGNSNLRFVLDEDCITRWPAPPTTPPSYEVAEPTDLQEQENESVNNSLVFSADDSELKDSLGDCDDRWAFRSPLALSSMTREPMSPSKEGRFFTPGIREEYEEFDGLSQSDDGDACDIDENGAFVSPKKGKDRLGVEMSGYLPSGTPRADGDALGVSDMSLNHPTPPEAQGDVAPPFTICHYEVADLPPTGRFRNP